MSFKGTLDENELIRFTGSSLQGVGVQGAQVVYYGCTCSVLRVYR